MTAISSRIFWSRVTRTWAGWTGPGRHGERPPIDRDALSGLLRTIQTIKDACGFLGYPQPEKVTHAGESLLTRFRDGQLTLNPALTTALLGMVDAVRQMLGSIEVSSAEGERDDALLIATPTRPQQSPEAPAKSAVVAVPEPTSDAAESLSSIGDILVQRAGLTQAESCSRSRSRKKATRAVWARFWRNSAPRGRPMSWMAASSPRGRCGRLGQHHPCGCCVAG